MKGFVRILTFQLLRTTLEAYWFAGRLFQYLMMLPYRHKTATQVYLKFALHSMTPHNFCALSTIVNLNFYDRV